MPVGLVRRGGRKRRVRADGGKKYEERRPPRLTPLVRVECGQHELIADAPPPERGSAVVQPGTVVNVGETVERPFRPRIPEPWHHRHSAVAAPRERGRHRLAMRGYQQ